MKWLFKFLLFTGFAWVASFAMDDKGYASIYESIAAFENREGGDIRIFNRPGYVKPIIQNLGNVLNSNWYVSAHIPQSFVFEGGLPFSLIPIGNDDKNFNENGQNVPTIFGGHGDPNNYEPTVYGNETLHNLSIFTYPYLQIGGSFYHARLVLRGMWLPEISELQKFNLLGIGAQYSFGHLFEHKLPSSLKGFDVSLALGYSSSAIGYQPEDYEGTLDLDVSAFTFDLLLGYRPVNLVEILLTFGYQYASMESSGHLISHAEGWNGQEINPNITVKGNNGFKFGIAVAFQFGESFHPVLGFDYSGKSSFTTNILYFRQQFGEDKSSNKKNVKNSDENLEDTISEEPSKESKKNKEG